MPLRRILLYWLCLSLYQHYRWKTKQYTRLVKHSPWRGANIRLWLQAPSPVQVYHNFKRKRYTNNFPTDWCKSYENRIRKEVVTFLQFHIFFGNISWPVLMNIQMRALVMSLPHNLSYIIYIKFWMFNLFPDTGKSISL